jgi:hypothetical protein
MRRALLTSLGSLCLALAAAPARAEPRHAFRLTYVRAPEAAACPPDGAELRRYLAGIMHYDPTRPDAARHVIVNVDRRGASLVGTAVRQDGAGREEWRREIATKSACHYLVEALAHAISAALGKPPEDAEPATPAPEPPAPPLPPPLPVALPAPPAAKAKPCPEILGGVEGIFTPLITPSASAGISPWFGVQPCALPLSFELGLRTTWSMVAAEKGPTYRVRSSYVSGVLAACVHVRAFFGCPVFEAGAVRARLYGDPLPVEWSPFVLTAGVRAGAAWAFAEQFTLRGFLEVQGVAKGPHLLWHGSEFQRTPAASIVLAVGLSIRVPSSAP